jgi:hypothetical protein
MAVVAIAALAIFGVLLKRRRDEYASRASSYALLSASDQTLEIFCLDAAASNRRYARILREQADHPYIVPSERTLPLPRGGFAIQDQTREQAEGLETSATEFEEAAKRHARRTAAFLLRKTKYERAARYPWLPVAPDPPEPRVPFDWKATGRPIQSR